MKYEKYVKFSFFLMINSYCLSISFEIINNICVSVFNENLKLFEVQMHLKVKVGI